MARFQVKRQQLASPTLDLRCAYNVSVEWDAPEDKYVWIKKGINFLKQGVQKNPQSPDLRWDTGQTYFHKLGFADSNPVIDRDKSRHSGMLRYGNEPLAIWGMCQGSAEPEWADPV